MKSELIIKLKEKIKKELDNCDPELWPVTCQMRSEEEGYKKIEKMIILYVARDRMPIDSAIALIEQEFQHGKG